MWNWIVNLWNKAVQAFKEFMAIALPIATQIVIGAMKDYAISVVTTMEGMDISDDQKRKQAFKLIMDEAKIRGVDLSVSLANTLIELAVQYLKAKAS